MKITKKKQIEDLQTVVAAQWRQINKLKLHLGRLVDIDWSDEREQPKLKQLDQPVFENPHVDDFFNYVALNAHGQSVFFSDKPSVHKTLKTWRSEQGSCMVMLSGYDASNWQNSLIERDKVELTGSDLCRAMLARGDKYISGFGHHHSDRLALESKFADTVSKHTQCFQSSQNAWDYFVPINNQGEPLTAADAGL